MESHLFRCQGIAKLFRTLGTCKLWPVGWLALRFVRTEPGPLFLVSPMTAYPMDRRASHLKHSASEKKKICQTLHLPFTYCPSWPTWSWARSEPHDQQPCEPAESSTNKVLCTDFTSLPTAWILHHYRLRGPYIITDCSVAHVRSLFPSLPVSGPYGLFL